MTESSGVLGMVGVELMGWTKVSKGNRSSSRRSRKLASTSQESTMEQFDKTDYLSTSESEKMGASVLERRFSAKAEEIPFKKRNILFPPISLSSSLSCLSPHLQIKEQQKPRTELQIVDFQVLSDEKTDVNDQFIHNMFETKQNPSEEDFSGIKMLAAVACNDKSHIDTFFDEATDMCKFSPTPTINSGKNMTHGTDGITDYKKNVKDNGIILDNIIFSKKQSEMDLISPKYYPNDAEFPTICSSSPTSGNFTTIDNDQNVCGTSSKQYLSLSERVHKTPHTLEEIKEEDCSCTDVEQEKNSTSHNVGMERSSEDSLLSDEHEDSGVTSGSNSDDDCPKFVDGADTLKLNDSRFMGVLESSNLGPQCVVAKDDSSRVGINLGDGDSDLEDGEFRDSFVHHWEGSETEYGEVEQVDYDSDDKDAFNERKEITPIGSMEDETLDTESRERLRTKYSRTQHNTEFFIKSGMNRLFDYRKSGTKLGADFDNDDRKKGDMDRNCYSTCLRTRHPHYQQKRYKGPDFSSYIPKDVVHGYSDRRANNSRGPMFERRVQAGNWSPESKNIPLYHDRFVRPGRPFSHEPNRGRHWDRHSPYYNHRSRSKRSSSDRDFDNSRTRFPEYTRLSESRDYYSPDERGRQRFRPSVTPDEVFHWTPQSYRPLPVWRNSSPLRSTTPKSSFFIGRGEKRRIMGERGPLVRWDGGRRACQMRCGSRSGNPGGERRSGRGGWGRRKGFVERWQLQDG